MHPSNEVSIFDDVRMPTRFLWWQKLMIGFVLLCAGLFALMLLWMSGDDIVAASATADAFSQLMTFLQEGLFITLLLGPLLVYSLITRNAGGWIIITFAFYFVLFAIVCACFSDENYLQSLPAYLAGALLTIVNLVFMHTKTMRRFFHHLAIQNIWQETIKAALPAMVLAGICGYLHLV
jgi:hypothetical protein